MDLVEESPKSRSLDGGSEESGTSDDVLHSDEIRAEESETSRDVLHSDEIRADSSGDVISEDLQKIPDVTESCNSDHPEASAFDSLVGDVASEQVVEKPMRNETVIAETEISSNCSQSPPSGTPVVDPRSPVLKKGSGLRKWKRVKRDLKKDDSNNADSAQILKRKVSNTDPSKEHGESKMKSMGMVELEGEDSVASVESRNAEINPHLVGTSDLDPVVGFFGSKGFSIGMDSDNSEEHSGKSSTAASAPRLKHEVLRTGRDRGKMKNFNVKGSTHVGSQKVQQGRGGAVDSSKKVRDGSGKYEKENSLSSVESDLRNSVVGILRWGSVVNSNGKHNGGSLKLDEHSDEAHTGEEVQSGYSKENRKAKNLFMDDSDGKILEDDNQNSVNCQSSSDLDPLMESMVLLQEAQEVLEKEIENIAAIGKEQVDNNELFEEMEACSSSVTLEDYATDLKKKVENLKSKLEEASTTLKAKEQKLCELETLLGNNHSPKIEFMCEEEVSLELELLLTAKMEAEIEYFILTRTTQNWKILSDDHLALFEEQKHLASDQERTMIKLREAEEKTVKLSEQTHMLEKYCKELAGMENVLRLQNKVCKFSLCIIVQIMLLFIALGLFLMHLLSPADGVVPT